MSNFNKVLLYISLCSSLVIISPTATADNQGNKHYSELSPNAERSSRNKRSFWIVGRFIVKPSTLIVKPKPMKDHFSKRLFNLVTLGLFPSSTVAEEIITVESSISNLNGVIATKPSIFTKLTDVTALVGEDSAADVVSHPINLPIVETMALVEDSQLYPIASYANTAMREALLEMEKEFTQPLKDAIIKGEVPRLPWSYIPQGHNARSVIANELKALSGKWAQNFEIGEYDPIDNKIDIRIYLRGSIDDPEKQHIFNVAKRHHRTGIFRVINYAAHAGEELENEVLESVISNNYSDNAGEIIEHDGRRFIVTNEELNGFKKLANANGTRLRVGNGGHLVQGNINGNAVPVYEENGTFRIFDKEGKRPLIENTWGTHFDNFEVIDMEDQPAPEKGFQVNPPQKIVNVTSSTNNCFYVTTAVLLNYPTTSSLASATGVPEFCDANAEQIKQLFRAAGKEIEIRRYPSGVAMVRAIKSLPEGSSAGVGFTRPKRVNEFGELVDQVGHIIMGYRDEKKINFFDFQKNPIDLNFSGWHTAIPSDAYQFLLFTPK
ncbi:hypothetical protein [Aliivibrio salmonicida]|uniref:hypothetical protein n=1 Tax=Aliivibrio salmonicida TaxID=40269 RepID=UPI003D0DC38A